MKCLKLILLLFVSVGCVGCKEYRVAKQLKQFSSETVIIPEDLQKIDNRIQTEVGDIDGIPVFVIYHDSLSCSQCQISHLSDLLGLYELSDSLGTFSVMSIFSPREEDYDGVMKDIMYRDFEYPVYIDYTGSFRKKNTCIPEDVRFHSFLLDGDGHPVYVGNPIASDDLFKVFKAALERIDCIY